MRDRWQFAPALVLGLACGASMFAAAGPTGAERGKAVSYDEGVVYVPKSAADNAPVLVLADSGAPATQELAWLTKTLDQYGVPALAPKLPPGKFRPDAPKGWTPTAALLARLEQDFKVKPGRLYALGFSASGQLAYELAFAEPKRFAGIVAAATLPPEVPKQVTDDQKRLVVLLIAPTDDMVFGMRFARIAQQSLDKAGITATIKEVPGGHGAPLQTHASVFLEWMGARVVAGADSQPRGDSPDDAAQLAAAKAIDVKWRKRLDAAPVSAPVASADLIAVYAADGAVHLLKPETGEELGVIAVQQAPRERGPVPATLVGDMLLLAIHSAKSHGSEPDTLVAVDLAKKQVAWRVTNDAGILSAAGGSEAGFYSFGSHDTNFHVGDLKSGVEKWKARTGVSCASSGRFGKGMVYFCGTDGVFAREAATGAGGWRAPLSVPFGQDSLALAEGRGILFLASGRKVFGLGVADGAQKWELGLESGCTGRPCASETAAFVPCGSTLVAVEVTGRLMWTRRFSRTPATGPAVQGDRVSLVLADGRLLLLDAATGAPQAVSAERLQAGCSVACSGQRYFAIAQSHEVVSLNPQ